MGRHARVHQPALRVPRPWHARQERSAARGAAPRPAATHRVVLAPLQRALQLVDVPVHTDLQLRCLVAHELQVVAHAPARIAQRARQCAGSVLPVCWQCAGSVLPLRMRMRACAPTVHAHARAARTPLCWQWASQPACARGMRLWLTDGVAPRGPAQQPCTTQSRACTCSHTLRTHPFSKPLNPVTHPLPFFQIPVQPLRRAHLVNLVPAPAPALML